MSINKVEFRLDSYDNGEMNNMVILSLVTMGTNMVKDVKACPIDADTIGEILNDWCDEYGSVSVDQKDAHELSPSEYIALTLDAEWSEFSAKREAERKAFEDEKNLKQAKKVYDMMMSSSFETWYPGTFMDHVEGEEDCKNKDAILEDIIRML